jgi:hypothetical protein
MKRTLEEVLNLQGFHNSDYKSKHKTSDVLHDEGIERLLAAAKVAKDINNVKILESDDDFEKYF